MLDGKAYKALLSADTDPDLALWFLCLPTARRPKTAPRCGDSR
jgi:hypothetical protein